MRRLVVALTLVAAACGGSTAATTPTEALSGCPVATPAAPSPPGITRLPEDPTEASIAITAAAFDCARDVVVVSATHSDAVLNASMLASAIRAPLLLGGAQPSAALDAEINRLDPRRVFVIGPDVAVGEVAGDVARIADDSVLLMGLRAVRSLDPASGSLVQQMPSQPAGLGSSGLVWMVDDPAAPLARAASVAATVTGGLSVKVDRLDLRRSAAAAQLIHDSSGGPLSLNLLGEFGSDAEWQAEVLASGKELPGGGYLLFPGKRLVALYGSPVTDALGVLGEQDAAGGIERLREILPEYESEGIDVVPAFEMITTVAAADAGVDGDYSNESEVETLRPWVDLAGREGVYVLLDLQPGRTDFLSQARYYEELLLEPHVGLALDPEWRLWPDQVHLQQIGRVEAAEVNEVVEWLAELTRENALPQKLLMLHQFRVFMLQDRETIEVPPELAVVIQMDGHGIMEIKMETWQILTTAPDAGQFWWGWKNFYDEDQPTPTPEHVVGLTPTVVFVSYQ